MYQMIRNVLEYDATAGKDECQQFAEGLPPDPLEVEVVETPHPDEKQILQLVSLQPRFHILRLFAKETRGGEAGGDGSVDDGNDIQSSMSFPSFSIGESIGGSIDDGGGSGGGSGGGGGS